MPLSVGERSQVGPFGSSWWRLQAGGSRERRGPPLPAAPGIKLAHPQHSITADKV